MMARGHEVASERGQWNFCAPVGGAGKIKSDISSEFPAVHAVQNNIHVGMWSCWLVHSDASNRVP
jgi:hypothetical protein